MSRNIDKRADQDLAGGSTLIIRQMRKYIPGVILALVIALTATFATPIVRELLPIPTIVLALLIGIALHEVANRNEFAAGLEWSVKTLLRVSIGLLGIRVAFSDIFGLGAYAAVLVILAMVVTILSGVGLARLLRINQGYGLLAGVATAVCGASAALATSTVIPNYPEKSVDLAFTIVAANAVSTLVMIAYPPLCALLGLGPQESGILLGATIHDMAQVVGAGYAVSDDAGNTAVIVKLFRVFLLLPVVVVIGLWFTRRGAEQRKSRVPIPIFALCFLALCVINSLLTNVAAVSFYPTVKSVVVQASNWGLLIAISALGLRTSLFGIVAIGWRHMALFVGTTLTILGIVTVGLIAAMG